MYALDIETAPERGIEQYFDETEVKLGNLKDEKKIQAKLDQAKKEFVEKGALNWMTGRITCICLYSGNGKDNRSFCEEDEDILLEEFWTCIADNVITWNGYAFDIPYIYMRSCLHKVPTGKDLHIKRYDSGSDWNRDLMQELCGWGANKYISLNKAAKFFLGVEKSGTGAGAIELWKEGKLEELKAYCMDDARLTWEIAHRVQMYI